jgi:hypothetical protein
MSELYILRAIAEAACEKLMQEIDEHKVENARLKTENERLHKVGDAMAKAFTEEGYEDDKHINAWNAAKDGKPTP